MLCLLWCFQVKKVKDHEIHQSSFTDLFSAELTTAEYPFPDLFNIRCNIRVFFNELQQHGWANRGQKYGKMSFPICLSLNLCRSGTQLDRSGSAVSLMPITVTPMVRQLHTYPPILLHYFREEPFTSDADNSMQVSSLLCTITTTF